MLKVAVVTAAEGEPNDTLPPVGPLYMVHVFVVEPGELGKPSSVTEPLSVIAMPS